MKFRAFFPLLAALCFALPAYAGGVVVTIKPLHSLVAAVMEGDAQQPSLLVDGKASVHTFALLPSQMRAIEKADLVFYMGDGFELFLEKIRKSGSTGVWQAMDKAPQVRLHPVRDTAMWETHEHEHDHDHEREGEKANDLHLWLSPANAKAMVRQVAASLSATYPEHAARYADNAKALEKKLDALEAALKPRMKALSGKTFVVFHDAYQYFEKDFGLSALGAITLHPEQSPGVKHVQEIRARIRKTGARCVFAEPSFDRRAVDALVEETGAKASVLDPEGALLAPGAALYFDLLEGLAAGFEQCLAR